jgi:hypothetical protein
MSGSPRTTLPFGADRERDRRRTMRRTLVVVLAAVVCLPVAAAELAGVTLPDNVLVGNQELLLNGIGLREKMMFDVYVAGLYLEEPASDASQILDSKQIKRLDMHFVYKKVSAKKLAKAWTEVVKGDTMVFTSVPGQGLQVEVKGQAKGVVDDEAFVRAFWAVFLGPKPPTSKLKEGLLQGR